MNDRTQKAFEFAADHAKQLITLSTGVIAVTITFSKDILTTPLGGFGKALLLCAWLGYLLTIIMGVWVLLALTGSLDPMKVAADDIDARPVLKNNVRIPSVLQIASFVVATILIIWFGLTTTSASAAKSGRTPVGEHAAASCPCR